jgi:hypothetical protein
MKQLYVLAFITGFATFANAQTVADNARAARAKRPATPAKIVITNENIKPDDTFVGEAPDPNDKPAADAKTETKPAGPAHDEKWWKEQFATVRAEIKKLQTQIPVLENENNGANREMLQRSFDPDGRGQKAIAESKTKLDNAKSDLTRAQLKETELQDNLRREGAPAGWAR